MLTNSVPVLPERPGQSGTALDPTLAYTRRIWLRADARLISPRLSRRSGKGGA